MTERSKLYSVTGPAAAALVLMLFAAGCGGGEPTSSGGGGEAPPSAAGGDPASPGAAETPVDGMKPIEATMTDSKPVVLTSRPLRDADVAESMPVGQASSETAADYPDLKIQTLTEGDGVGIEVGQQGKFRYAGVLLDGVQFENGERTIRVGPTGAAIRGWQLGLVGMKPGEKRQLTVPAELGYGERSHGQVPAHSTLVYYFELLEIVE